MTRSELKSTIATIFKSPDGRAKALNLAETLVPSSKVPAFKRGQVWTNGSKAFIVYYSSSDGVRMFGSRDNQRTKLRSSEENFEFLQDYGYELAGDNAGDMLIESGY